MLSSVFPFKEKNMQDECKCLSDQNDECQKDWDNSMYGHRSLSFSLINEVSGLAHWQSRNTLIDGKTSISLLLMAGILHLKYDCINFTCVTEKKCWQRFINLFCVLN